VRAPGRPRRSPAPQERQADAERSRRQLLAAAFDEFSAKGYAGARVHEIAARAGVNKQLINYYFGGKEGLYRQLEREWLDREATFNDPGSSLADIAVRYLRDALADPRGVRLMVWRGLASEQHPSDDDPDPSVRNLYDRQAADELDPEMDPECVLLAMMGVISAPIVMPDMVRKIFGMDPSHPDFERRYGEQVRRMVERLAPR
jgi:AcrR family transcriptional regulator